MFELVLLTAALVRDHPAEFRQAWANAKALASLRDRYCHGLIDMETLLREGERYMTPQQKEEVWKALDPAKMRAILAEKRKKIFKAASDAARQARPPVGPPPPPDVK
jgi:hypothetical protein